MRARTTGLTDTRIASIVYVSFMAYVPPHMRNNQNGSSQASSSPKSLESRALQERTKSISSQIYSLDDLSVLLECNKQALSTLVTVKSPSAEELDASERSLDGGVLRAIILHEGQHPEWKGAHKILCKSNLHALRTFAGDQEDENDGAASHNPQMDAPDSEYPLFQQVPFQQVPFMKKGFEFAGWWRIQNVVFLPPRSTELVALFEKKFDKQNGRGRTEPFTTQRGKPKVRTEEAWRESLDREWAVVSLVQNHARTDQPELSLWRRSSSGQQLSMELGVGEDDESKATERDVER